MKTNMNIFFASAIFFTLVSCGSAIDHSKLNSSESIAVPLIVAIGGNESCGTTESRPTPSPYGMGMFEKLEKIREDITTETGVTPNFIATCYADTGLKLVSSWNPEIEAGLSDETAIKFIREKAASAETSKTLLAGHSYGGWLAMKILSASLTDDSSYRIYTIDPISKVRCTFSTPEWCTQAPPDIKRAERKFISENSEKWINFWQDTTYYLHSSPIDEADENPYIYQGHTDIDTDTAVWEVISASFIENL